MNQFNYKDIHFWLLSFFGVLVILFVSGSLPSEQIADSVIKYSIFGIILCLISWTIELNIYYKAEGIMESFAQDIQVHEILGNLNKNRIALILALFLAFIIFLLPDIWLIIWIIVLIIYLYIIDDLILSALSDGW